MITLGAYFKGIREKSGLTQFDLAEKLGYTTPQFVSNVERGRCMYPLNKMKTIIKATKANSKEVHKKMVEHYAKRIQKFF